MAVILNQAGFVQARQLIGQGKVVVDERAGWSKPSAGEENTFIAANGLEAFGRWHLAIDGAKPADAKGRYEFPYGDFQNVRRSALLAAESRAGQYKHAAVEDAAKQLLAMLKG